MRRKVIKEYNIGDTIQNDKVDVVIINKEIRYIKEKYGYKGQEYKDTPRLFYLCHCNKCNNDYWKRKADVEDHGCPICAKSSLIVVQGYNDFATSHPELVEYFANKNDASKYTSMSNKKVELKCPTCGFKKTMPICRFVRQGFGCPVCSDGVSYPEKFFISLLRQLDIDFIYQLSKKNFKWCGKYKYDFYLPKYKVIIEVHGGQHYKDTTYGELEEQNKNDEDKKQLALKQNFNYIIIDARKSNKDFIKESILCSKLNEILCLDDINWNKCHEESLSSNIKQACSLWNDGFTTGEIATYIGVEIPTIQNYLHKGSIINLCDYTPDKGRKRALSDVYNKMCKNVAIYKDDCLVGQFNSINELSNKSLEYFGIYFDKKRISDACRGVYNLYEKYGYTFKIINNIN